MIAVAFFVGWQFFRIRMKGLPEIHLLNKWQSRVCMGGIIGGIMDRVVRTAKGRW